MTTTSWSEFAQAAKELGIEMLVMDDGWFGDRCDDHRALGGLAGQRGEAQGRPLPPSSSGSNALGIQFGIWYEPEMISPDSDLYRGPPGLGHLRPGPGEVYVPVTSASWT